MTARLVFIFFVTAIAVASHAAEKSTTEEKSLTPKEALKARMRAEGRKQAAAPAPATSAASPATSTPGTKENTPSSQESAIASKDSVPPSKEIKKKDEAPPQPTLLPKMEVKNSRITELDQKVAKQEQDIAREKQNTKSTETDRALNDPKVSKIFSIFGGESSAHRAGIAQERVSLMESERDILEAMKTARTKEEKAELQKQLDELRAYRRELEKSLR